MTDFNPQEIEAKWQGRWRDERVFRAKDPDPTVPRFYCLEMLPYPSGRIHMGHVRNYTIGDAIARFRRMRGEQVLHTTGWDAFGMPAENAAIQNHEEPRAWTLRNIDAMRAQLTRLGISYDWDREVATCEPEYYRWNQWFFLKMFERGLAYRAKRLLNWCDSCGTVLANEQVIGGRCWRCDNPVTRREFEQWFLRITDYSQELLDDLDTLDGWPEKVRTMQRNWIGRSDGARVLFAVEGSGEPIEIFTTRIDTIYGATYVALALEHPAVAGLVEGSKERDAVLSFVREQTGRTVEDRFEEGAEKLGVFTGRYAVNPFSKQRVPIWVANFVLADVGTGAIMSVPAHDERDFAFARQYGLPVRPVVRPAEGGPLDPGKMEGPFCEDGVLHDSGPYDDLESGEARRRMTAEAESRGIGGGVTTFRLKDWGISRQRYWGTPIPIVHCERCGIVPVPERDLPVLLPEQAPLTGEGGSPLARIPSFVNVPCPKCSGSAKRDTDTMDTFVDSSWYFFRYTDPENRKAPFDWSRVAPWFPVPLYIGGIEHATLHLIYTRFWTKMMRDLSLLTVDEPVQSLFTQGMVIKDGAKMSKSKGNVVDPDWMVARYGADTTRLFSLFAAPPERDLEWSEAGVEGSYRFLGRVWRSFERVRPRIARPGTARPPSSLSEEAQALRRKTHRTIRKVTDDLGPRMHLNTAVSSIMEWMNLLSPLTEREDLDEGGRFAVGEAFEILAKILSPLAPHFAEEVWAGIGGEGLVCRQTWPEPDEALLEDEASLIVVQVNGKVRGRISVPRGAAEEVALRAAREDGNVASQLEGKTVRRVVFVPDRLLNVVVS